MMRSTCSAWSLVWCCVEDLDLSVTSMVSEQRADMCFCITKPGAGLRCLFRWGFFQYTICSCAPELYCCS